MADLDPFMGDDYGSEDYGEELGHNEIGAVVARTLAKAGVRPTASNVTSAVRTGLATAGAARQAGVSPGQMVQAGKRSVAQRLEDTLPGGSDTGRVQKCPIDSGGTIGAGLTQSISARPQRRFRADRFTISPGSTNWLVNSIQIGVDPQFVSNSGSTGGGEFDPLATNGANLRGTTADPGIDIAVSVTNTTAGALRFTGSFTGPSVD